MTKEKEISRDRFIMQACEQALNNIASEWPDGFFNSDLNEGDLQLLKEGVQEMEDAIIQRRKHRKNIPL